MGPDPNKPSGDYAMGDTVVLVDGQVGTIKFMGKVHFESGCWYGIELRDGKGSGDGSVDSKRYFKVCGLAIFCASHINVYICSCLFACIV